jgi:predicted Rossmann fold flavoprotein
LYNTADTIGWFEERGVKLKTEADGRIFPVTDSSQTIIDCLIREANKYEVEIIANKSVDAISINDHHPSVPNFSKRFRLNFSNKSFIDADFVCVACGGFPKASQFDWLRNTGHSFENPVPSLFTFNMPGNSITSLMGVSVNKVTVKIQSSRLTQTGPLLITHWGISGPVVLKLSAWGARELSGLNYHFTTIINWVSQYNENSLRNAWPDFRRRYASQQMNYKNPFDLPARLWGYFLNLNAIPHALRWSDLSAMQQNKHIKILTSQELQVKGKTTFKEEFVTCGGIKISEIDPNTMQSKIVPGLFFAGEIMDADGITGGFNFQHAWTSGWIAAKNIAATAEVDMTSK